MVAATQWTHQCTLALQRKGAELGHRSYVDIRSLSELWHHQSVLK